MLHIILGILKILGFLLLLIFLLLLALILIVLFVPIRYRLLADWHDDILVEGKITWLLHLVSVMIAFRDRKLEYSVKILGITLAGNEKKEPKALPQQKSEEAPEEIRGEYPLKSDEKEPDEQVLDIRRTEDLSEDVPEGAGKPEKSVGICEKAVISEKKAGIGEKIRGLLQKAKDTVNSLRKKILNIRQTIENVRRKIDRFSDFWNAKATQNMIRHGKKEMIYLLKHFGPRKLEGNVRFGLEDPGTTGQVLGYLSILQGFTGNHLQVEADFDEKVIEGKLFLKGHIRCCHFIKAALCMIFDKNVRITIRRLLKMRG